MDDTSGTVTVAFECADCGREFRTTRTACPDHGRRLVPVYDPAVRDRFDPGTPTGLWRYRPFLPVAGDDPVTIGEGGTPLVAADGLSERFDLSLSLKCDGANPTGSSKDRGSSLLVTHAREQGASAVACASTGNAAASVAAYAARAGLQCPLFVPAGLPEGKASQPVAVGADVYAVEGDYDDAFDLCRRVTGDGMVDRSAGAGPHVPAGARTLGFELAEQADGADWLAVAMGNGGTAAAAWEGWRAFDRLGFAEGSPKLLGVQAAGASAIHDAFHDGSDDPADAADTCADSIAVGRPHRAAAACRALEASGGTAVTVEDRAIERSTASLARTEGILAERACGAAIAGVRAARNRGVIDRGEEVVAVLTGHGLKDTTGNPPGTVERVDTGTDPRAIRRRYSADGE